MIEFNKINKQYSVELVPFQEMLRDPNIHKTYLSWLNDRVVTRLIASPVLDGCADESLVLSSFDRFTRRDSQGFFIRHKKGNEYIGTAKLDKISHFKGVATDGIMIGNKNYWGRGISVEVYHLLLRCAFFDLNLIRVNGGCNEFNIPMRRTFERVGYKLEGRARKSDLIDGIRSDHLYYGILRTEYEQNNSAYR